MRTPPKDIVSRILLYCRFSPDLPPMEAMRTLEILSGVLFIGLGITFYIFSSTRQSLKEVSERKKAQDAEIVALKEIADIRSALDAHSMVARTDTSGKITYVNDKFCEISQYSCEELIGQDHRIINSSYHHKSFFTDLWKTIGRGEVWKGEIRNRAKSGSCYWVQTTIYPLLDGSGRPRQYIAIQTDVTQQKEAEARLILLADELAAKNKELETMLYVISHDLRAPFLNVQGFGTELSRKCQDLKEKISQKDMAEVNALLETDLPRALRFIEAGISKMDGLLNGFLRFSRMGRVVLHVEQLKMHSLLSGCVQALSYQIQQIGATIEMEALPDCLGDAILVGQVFTNLIENALKYRNSNQVCVIKITGRIENSHAIYTISDNGIGIAAEHQSKVFELFHRLNPKHTEGDGLGLAIAQQIVERLRGRIWLDSEVGTGTNFHVALPAKASL